MALGHRPQAVRARVVGGALVDEGRRPQKSGPENEPWPHHPTHVGDPVDAVSGMYVGAEAHILSGFHGKTTVGMNRPFGSARRPGGVDDHQRILGGGVRRWGVGGCLSDDVVPPVISPGKHVDGNAGVAQHHNCLERIH